jgi:hypothetical protein
MKFIIFLTVVAFSGVGWLLLVNVPALLYDATTEKTGKTLDRWDEEKWQQVYEEVRPIYLSQLPETQKGETVKLSDGDFPLALRGLGFDRAYATAEGVHFLRVGSDGNHKGTWIHCIYRPKNEKKKDSSEEWYSPDVVMHDRKGIWFHGFSEQRWAYETSGGN